MNCRLRSLFHISAHKILSFSLVVVLLVLNFSCATVNMYRSESYDQYYGIDQDKSSCDAVTEGIDREVCMARKFNSFRTTKFGDEFRKLNGVNTFLFDLPILGLAIATGATAIFTNSTNLIAALGIGTAGAFALRQYANSRTKAGFFLSAMEASQCVWAASAIFDIPDGISGVQDVLNVDSEALNLKLKQSQQAFVDPMLQDATAKKALEDAIAAAKAALKLEIDANTAISTSPSTIVSATDTIYIALQKKLDGAIPDVNKIISDFKSAIEKKEETEQTQDEVNNQNEQAQNLLGEGEESNFMGIPCDGDHSTSNDEAKIKAQICAADLILISDRIAKTAPQYTKADSDIKACAATGKTVSD